MNVHDNEVFFLEWTKLCKKFWEELTMLASLKMLQYVYWSLQELYINNYMESIYINDVINFFFNLHNHFACTMVLGLTQ
jgi:hypothetical protein